MNKLETLISRLENYIPNCEIHNSKVSTANIGWHLEHSFLTIKLITEGLKDSDPSQYKWIFKLSRIIIFTIKKIPRGKAKSPKVVIPEKYDIETLKKHIVLVKQSVQELNHLDPNKYFYHPYFGNLKLKATIKFLEIHTNHHLEIIQDINSN